MENSNTNLKLESKSSSSKFGWLGIQIVDHTILDPLLPKLTKLVLFYNDGELTLSLSGYFEIIFDHPVILIQHPVSPHNVMRSFIFINVSSCNSHETTLTLFISHGFSLLDIFYNPSENTGKHIITFF